MYPISDNPAWKEVSYSVRESYITKWILISLTVPLLWTLYELLRGNWAFLVGGLLGGIVGYAFARHLIFLTQYDAVELATSLNAHLARQRDCPNIETKIHFLNVARQS